MTTSRSEYPVKKNGWAMHSLDHWPTSDKFQAIV